MESAWKIFIHARIEAPPCTIPNRRHILLGRLFAKYITGKRLRLFGFRKEIVWHVLIQQKECQRAVTEE